MEQGANHWKTAFITLLIIVVGTALLFGAYYYFYTNRAKSASQNPPVSVQPSLMLSPTAGQSGSVDLGSQIGANGFANQKTATPT